MTCPLEKELINLFLSKDIEFTRPELDKNDPTSLDYYIPKLELYIEVKQFHSDRISNQLKLVPKNKSAIVLMGPKSISSFINLIKLLS